MITIRPITQKPVDLPDEKGKTHHYRTRVVVAAIQEKVDDKLDAFRDANQANRLKEAREVYCSIFDDLLEPDEDRSNGAGSPPKPSTILKAQLEKERILFPQVVALFQDCYNAQVPD